MTPAERRPPPHATSGSARRSQAERGWPARTIAASLVAAFAVALVGGSAPSRATAAGVTDWLPDLRMAQLRDFRTSTSNGRRLLRLTTIILNSGEGAFELTGRRSSTGVSTMTVRQRIFDSGGGSREIATNGQGRYAGDGHSHWHIQNVSTMQLLATNGGVVKAGSKVGFCFFDTNLFYPDLPRSPGSPFYRGSGCGTSSSLSVKMGVSVGWGDKYQYSLPYQWVDITGVASGTYTVRAIVDSQNYYREKNESNNCTWTRLRLTSGGVEILEHGRTCLGWVPPPLDRHLGPRPAPADRPDRT